MNETVRSYILIAGAATVLVALVVIWIRARRKTPEQREQERRSLLNAGGRIADGTVVDVQEMNAGTAPAQLLIYQYDVAGVTYHCSQDVTRLRHHIDLHSCRLGLRASVKYDPQNPGNSIVIAEGWTGLRA